MTKEELIDSIRNNRSFDLRSSEYYEPWDVLQETIKEMADDFYYLLKDVLDYLEEPKPKFDIGDTIRLKGSKAEYTITSISGGCYHGKGWGLPISAEKDYELVESAEDVDAQINSQNEAIKQLNSALNSMERNGHLPKMMTAAESLGISEEEYAKIEDEFFKEQEEPVRGDFEMALAEMIDKAQKCVVEPWIVAAQWKDELVKLAKECKAMQEHPKDCMYSKDNYTDEDRKILCEGCEEDCKYNKKEEPISEDLEKELPKVWDRETLDEYAYQVAYDLSNDRMKETPTWNDVETACKLGAEWQKQKDRKWLADNHKQIFNNGWSEGYEIGRDSMEEDMMKDAVKGDAYYDYTDDKGREMLEVRVEDVSAEEYNIEDGDKVKLIIIKEG